MAKYLSIEAATIDGQKVHRAVFGKWYIVEAGDHYDQKAVTRATALRDNLCITCVLRPVNQNVQMEDIAAGQCGQVWVHRIQTKSPYLTRVRVEAMAKRGTFRKKNAACGQ